MRGDDGHGPPCFAAAGAAPARCKRAVSRGRPAQLEQPDQRLRVAHLVDQPVERGERAADDLDARGVGRRRTIGHVLEPGREVDVDLLVAEARRHEAAVQVLPARGALADLLRQLALRALQRRLAGLVELARRDLEQVRDADRLARLAHEPDLVGLDRHDADRARVVDDLAGDLAAVVVAERVDPDGDHPALPGDLPAGALHPPQAAAASPSSASVTSSIPSSAATATRSVGSWLRSVPLATFTQVTPAACSAFASEAPPVTTRRAA